MIEQIDKSIVVIASSLVARRVSLVWGILFVVIRLVAEEGRVRKEVVEFIIFQVFRVKRRLKRLVTVELNPIHTTPNPR